MHPNKRGGTMLKHRKLPFNQLSISLLILIFVLSLSNCAAIYRSGFIAVPRQAICDSITIGSEWVEIVPPKPLKPFADLQDVVIGYDDFNRNNYSDNSRNSEILNLADGKSTKIEAVLFDEKGESYELRIVGTGGIGGGIAFGRKLKTEIVSGKTEYVFQGFPADRVYTKLKIKSEIPLAVSWIEWVCYNNK